MKSTLAERPVVASGKVLLLPDEPAGKILVKNAGTFEVRASLTWRSCEEIPKRQLRWISSRTGLQVLPHENGLGCDIEGQLSVFDEKDSENDLGFALRRITNLASISEAVLETRVFRVASPGVPGRDAVCGLARYLWDAGVRVTFGHTKTPLLGAEVALGTGGSNGKLESILLRQGSWETVGAELG